MKIKTYRKLHSSMVIFLVIFFILISLTGVILAWKKNTAGILLPNTQKGVSGSMSNWLTVDSLKTIAVMYLNDSVSSELSAQISKIDIRPSKGIAKFIFTHAYYEIQVDCTTGWVLSVSKRHSDWIEQLHDGSIVDNFFDIKAEPFKVIYSSIIGLASLFMTFTGIMIWIKRKKKIMKNFKML